MDNLPTVRVINPATHVGYMIINAIEFVDGVHERWTDGEEAVSGDVSAAHSSSAVASIIVKRGPRGKWYIFHGSERSGVWYETEAEAIAATQQVDEGQSTEAVST